MADPIKVINDIIGAQDQLGDFIANGPDTGLPGFVRNQYRDRCDEFANVPQWAKNLNPIGQLSFGRFCRPWWDSQGVDGPEQRPPFEGGQCDTQLYLVILNWFVPGGVPENQTTGFVTRGPITSVDLNDVGGSFRVRATSRSELVGSFTCGPAPALGPLQSRQRASPAIDINAEQLQITATPCGFTDNCGSLPTDLFPGPNAPLNPGPNPVGDPVDDPDGGPIPDIPLPPYEDPVGGPTPIDPGPEPGGGGGGGNPPNATGGDGLPGDGDAVGGPAGGAAGGEDGEDVDFGTPPDGKVWVGALIECTVDPRLGNIPGTGPQNTVYPTAIANASLRYSTGYGTSRIIRSKWTELARPVTALVVEGVFVQAQPGVTASVRPISATICPENPCESE